MLCDKPFFGRKLSTSPLRQRLKPPSVPIHIDPLPPSASESTESFARPSALVNLCSRPRCKRIKPAVVPIHNTSSESENIACTRAYGGNEWSV